MAGKMSKCFSNVGKMSESVGKWYYGIRNDCRVGVYIQEILKSNPACF
jgi:hypothetical protein